jgi:GT2 family glycosyltransferase
MSTLSICCITQNSLRTLPRFLQNASIIADEIIIVDGGSMDGTADLLKSQHGIRYFERPFDSVTKQKNFAIEQASCDWVLLLDSDELLGDNALSRIPTLIQSKRNNWYKFARYWITAESKREYVHTDKLYPDFQLRLFRNIPFFRYDPACKVHEHFPRQGRGHGKKLYNCHIIHLAFTITDKQERKAKAEHYSALDPDTAQTNKMYLWEDLPHEIKPCAETWLPEITNQESKEKLALVTVNWKQDDLTKLCLKSLQESTRKPDLIVVVNNEASEESSSAIKKDFPGITLINKKDNTGFTGGYNTGIAEAVKQNMEMILLLNNDTEVLPDTLKNFMTAEAYNPDAEMFGATQILKEDDSTGPFHYFRWNNGKVKFAGHNRDTASTKGEVFLSCCAIMVRTSAINKIGPLDERFFIYSEDIEWSMRARRKGVKMLRAAGTAVHHKLSSSTEHQSETFLYYDSRNRFLLGCYAPLLMRIGIYTLGTIFRLIKKARQLVREGQRAKAEAIISGIWAGKVKKVFGKEIVKAPTSLINILLP